MAKKIEIQGKALTVTDTISLEVELSQPKKDIWYSEDSLQALSRIHFYDTNNLNGEYIYNPEIPHYQLSECVDENDVTFTVSSFREFCENNLGANGGVSVEESTGWAQYKDDQYTSGSPLVISAGATTTLDNNAGSTITTQLPVGVTALYDSLTNKITPENSGDAYLVRVDFTAFTSSPSGLAKLQIDIGGAQGIIIDRGFTFPKGTGSGNAQDYSMTSLVYSLSTFVANGGTVQIESVTGDTSVYDINFVISRVHKAR